MILNSLYILNILVILSIVYIFFLLVLVAVFKFKRSKSIVIYVDTLKRKLNSNEVKKIVKKNNMKIGIDDIDKIIEENNKYFKEVRDEEDYEDILKRMS